MKYLGGKYRIAKKLRAAMEPYIQAHDHKVWEPFCGGLNFSRVLGDCTGILSDAHPALMALYQGYRDGWEPPETVSREDHTAAKLLPDSDPLKAFVGFGCSFAGTWFGGFSEDRVWVVNRPGQPKVEHHHARAAAKSLKPLRSELSGFELVCCSFMDVRPRPIPHLIYCDPPYAGTRGYKGLPRFDHDLFWKMCQRWASHTTVLVTEYVCPVPAKLILEIRRNRKITHTTIDDDDAPTERLFRVLPRGEER